MALHRLVNVFVGVCAATLLLSGCFGQSGSGDPGSTAGSSSSASGPAAVYDTTSIDVSIGDGSGSSAPGALFVGTFADVVRVEVVVSGEDKYGDFQANLATVELTEGPPGVWSGTIPDLPVDPELNFAATGYDASDTVIFTGATAQVLLGGGGDVVAIQMLPYDDNVAILFPIINSITRPAEIINNEDAAVDVAVTGSSDETLTYEYTSGGGTFTAPSGSITVASNGAGTINTTYTAPDPVGPYSHSIRLTNSQGNSVETDFGTLIVYELTDATVTTSWAPVITALSGHRTGGDVTWTATVTDDQPLSELTFSWGFAQTDGPTASFSTGDANPGVMSGYDETVAGEVTLSVTDADGLTTTVTFTLNAGQFPDVVVVEPNAALDCVQVNGLTWCFNNDACGEACNAVCASKGLTPVADSSLWFNAQNDLAECQALSEALGMGTAVNLVTATYGCLEDTFGLHSVDSGLNPPLYCSTIAACPDYHRTLMDQLGSSCGSSSRRSICPCE